MPSNILLTTGSCDFSRSDPFSLPHPVRQKAEHKITKQTTDSFLTLSMSVAPEVTKECIYRIIDSSSKCCKKFYKICKATIISATYSDLINERTGPFMNGVTQFFLLFLVVVLTGWVYTGGEEDRANPTGQMLAEKFIIVDGHIDLPYRLENNWEDVSNKTENGDFDYPRAKKGGLDAPFMSIYIPSRYQETGGAKEAADSLIALVNSIAEEHPDKFAMAESPEDIREQFEKGLISLPMGMENGAPIGTDLSNVEYFYDQGIRYITLTHSKDNKISDSSYDMSKDTHDGLSDFGKDVVREMNRLGMMVDVSHISDEAFWDVMEVTRAPVLATHSSCRHFTPGFERNMSDALITRLADNGGVIMINFGSTFLDSTSAKSQDDIYDQIDDKMEEQGISAGGAEAQAFRESYREEHFVR